MSTPRVREVPGAPEPAEACALFLDLPHCLLLESLPGFGRLGRFSFLAADPFLVLRAKDGRVEEAGPGGAIVVPGDPFTAVEERLRRWATDPVPGAPPFQGGAAGYLGYDLCHQLERLPAPRFDDLALPDLDLGFYDRVLAWDHAAGRAWLVSTGLPEPPGAGRERRAAEREREALARLAEAGTRASSPRPRPDRRPVEAPSFPVPGLPGIRSTFTPQAYRAAVARTIEYIRAGDIFQANLSQRLEVPWPGSAFDLYRRLRRTNPAPFAAFFDAGPHVAVASASPERFLRLSEGAVEARPIKGTRPRGYTPQHDMALDESLRASEKDRAENVMIVDLLRNDLSRACVDGSVAVPELCVLERHATVHHLVSTVTGRLRPGLGPVDLLRAAFPGGSVTGAPKVRAMEIIAELEPTRRGVYCGSIGYLGFDGSLDTSIVIRTFVLRPGERAWFQVGGAVVADSDPGAEYEETLHKAGGLLAALGSRG